jgi:LytS/YehU family sensor histidine kinase
VNDTGLGCDIDYINTSNGFGLTQVAQRLATIYGDQGSIHFITTSEFATSVQVKFPCIKQFNN